MISLPEELTWDEMFSNVVIVDDDTRVFKNTCDDHNLGGGFIFAGGKHISGDWICCYVKMMPCVKRMAEKWICEGIIGSVKIIEWDDGWKLIFQAKNGIGAGIKLDMVGRPPEKLLQFFERG